MKEIASIIEKKHNVKIEIIKGGSAKLYTQLKKEKDGDLYLPGSDSYIKKNMKDGFLGYNKYIGYNQAAILVPKGNPKGIKDLNDFAKSDVNVVIGATNAGSVGTIAKSVLIKFKNSDFYNTIYSKAIKAPSSSEITNALISGKADAAISWRATASWAGNSDKIDVVEIPSKISPKKRLKITLLKFSKHQDIAKDMIKFSASPDGSAIMKKYGFR
jgi:molybdate transport system substrate-binding protein